MNPWEASALQYNFPEDDETRGVTSHGTVAVAVTATAPATAVAVAPGDRIHDPVIYPGLYAPSGFDMMSILIQVKTRPNPVVELGAVDASCALLMCDLLRPDHPIVYASEAFEALTGYSQREILGRNCRFLQQAPPPPPPLPPSSRPQAPASPPPLVATRRHHSHRHQQHPHHLNPHNHHRISRSHSSATTTTRRRRTDNASGSGNSNDNGSSSSSSRDGIYDMKSIRRQLRHAIETNAELVVEIPNFRKDGRPFINFLTIIPVRWDGGNGGGATTTTPRYSVGFQVEKTW